MERFCDVANIWLHERRIGVAGGDPAVYRAYNMWDSPEKEEFTSRHNGRHLWAVLDDVRTRDWREIGAVSAPWIDLGHGLP